MLWVLAISVSLLGYIYAGYPLLIWLLAKFRGRPVRKGPFSGGVSILIAAHDEAVALPRKLANLLERARTEPIREIWIGLDGCTDGTGERVREAIDQRLETSRDWSLGATDQRRETKGQGREIGNPSLTPVVYSLPSGPSVCIIEFERQRGKAAVLNDLMAQAGQPILVMMDARQRVDAGAIGQLLESFADDRVGVVSGALVYESAEGGTQKGAQSYWGYEKFLRQCESRFWAVPGATGALYAIRRELCRPMPENTLVDDVLLPMRAVLMGYRCLFEPSACVFDLPTERYDQEGGRKRRTLAGIWQLASIEPKISSVFANPIWFQWVSHKYLRLLTPFILIFVYFSLGVLASGPDPRFLAIFGVALALLAVSAAAYGSGQRHSSRLLGVMGAFYGVNLALLRAAADAWIGRFEARWKT
jgi:cellulose synthase/poly-beta-1,6-N-acetylglucosamine synthase-like glycosyltransferase